MRSWKFPQMLNSNSSNIWKPTEYMKATFQNAVLTLHSEKGELIGDPYFGTTLKHLLFDQNSIILKDALIDQIYVQLALFLPQIRIDRKNIKVVQNRGKGSLTITFSGISQIDYTNNIYNLELFNEDRT